MSISASLKDVRTPEWAQEVMEYLGISEDESSDVEEEEDLAPAPFVVRLGVTERRNASNQPARLERTRNRPKRQRILGIRRKTQVEIKTQVLNKMVEEEPSIQKEMDQATTKAIFIEKDSVTVLRPHNFKRTYYELTDLQYNLFVRRVKEETEKDRLEVISHKSGLLQELNQRSRVEEGAPLLI